MKTTKTMQRAALAALAGMALAAASAQAQGVNDLIIDQFGSPGPSLNSPITVGDPFGGGFNYTCSTAGLGDATITWSSATNSALSPSNPTGALKVVIPFDWSQSGGWSDFVYLKCYEIGLEYGNVNLLNYQSLEFDVYVDPASCTNTDLGQFGPNPIEVFTRNVSNNDDTSGLGAFTVQPVFGQANYGNWVHYSLPVNHALGGLSTVGMLLFNIDGSSGVNGTGMNGNFNFWIDNMYLVTNAAPANRACLSRRLRRA
jgi:hypothetical protein